MGFILIAITLLLTISAFIISIIEAITKRDKRKLIESAFILSIYILSWIFILFYIFIAENEPPEKSNTFIDYITVGILCVLWTIAFYFGFFFLNGRLMKLSILFQTSLSYLIVIIGLLGAIYGKITKLDGVLSIRIICTGIITIAIILLIIKEIRNRKKKLIIKKT